MREFDKKLRKKIIAEDTPLQEVIKLGIASEQAAKAADRIRPRQEQEQGKNRIAALEEQVRALAAGGAQKPSSSCRTCTRGTHAEGKYKAATAQCHACQKTGHFKGAKACPLSGRGKGKVKPVRAVDTDQSQENTDSEADINRVEEVVIRSSIDSEQEEELAVVKLVVLDKGRPAPQKNVKFLVDSGVKKTLLSEEMWRSVQKKAVQAGVKEPQLKICKTKFRPYGTKLTLPIMGRSKCKLQAQAGANIRTMVYVVQGKEQSLLGRHDGMRLGIISVNCAGGEVPQQIARLGNSGLNGRLNPERDLLWNPFHPQIKE